MTVYWGGARRRRSYPTGISSTTAGGGGGGVVLPEPFDSTGAFASYRMQDAFGSLVIADELAGARNLTGTNAPSIAPHPLFPSRQYLRPVAGNYTSPIDAAGWTGTDWSVDMVVFPFASGGGIWFQMQTAAAVGFALLGDSANNRYSIQWNGFAGNTTTNKRYQMDGGGINPNGRPYCLRLERENIAGTINVRVYVDGYLRDTITTAVVPPNSDRLLMGNNPSVFMSDVIFWNTATPPISALDQAKRVLPYLLGT